MRRKKITETLKRKNERKQSEWKLQLSALCAHMLSAITTNIEMRLVCARDSFFC